MSPGQERTSSSIWWKYCCKYYKTQYLFSSNIQNLKFLDGDETARPDFESSPIWNKKCWTGFICGQVQTFDLYWVEWLHASDQSRSFWTYWPKCSMCWLQKKVGTFLLQVISTFLNPFFLLSEQCGTSLSRASRIRTRSTLSGFFDWKRKTRTGTESDCIVYHVIYPPEVLWVSFGYLFFNKSLVQQIFYIFYH